MRVNSIRSAATGGKHAGRVAAILCLSGAIIIAVGDEAHAYLDPGTTSMLSQFLIAAVVAVALTIRRSLKAVKKLLLFCVPRQFRDASDRER